jgi:hypothetical protein
MQRKRTPRTTMITVETVTFALAMLGFAGLAASAALAAWRRPSLLVALPTSAAIAAHVALVWAFRYGGSLAQATRNGYAGFVIFHAALLAIVASLLVPRRVASWLLLAAFAAVCVGAIGAVFRYNVVAVYRVPVIACALAGWSAIALGWWKARSRDGRQAPSPKAPGSK